MRARICSTLPAPLASPKNSHASETFNRAESLKNPPADNLVVRVVGLEEKRLTRGQHTELTATAGLPEIHFRQLRPGRQEPIPRGIGNAHIRAHERYRAPVNALMPVNPAPAGNIQRSTSGEDRHIPQSAWL
jgi:hypothetical protein